MRIQIRILLSIGTSLLISAAILLAVFLVLQGMAAENARGRVFGEIKNKINDLNLSVSRFPDRPYPSRIRQITDMQRSLEEHFQTLTAVNQGEASLIRSVRANLRELRYSVEKLISGSMASGAMSPEHYNVLLSQLWMKTQFISDDTNQLLRSSQSRVAAAQKNTGFLTIGLIIALIVTNALITFFFGKRIAADQGRLQKALAKAEAGDRLLTALMDHVPEGITICDNEMNLTMVSRHGLGLLGGHQGLSTEEVVRSWKVYQPDGITPMPVEDLPLARAVRQGETIKSVELVQVNDRGQKLPLLCNAAPIRDTAGTIVGGIVAWRDISDRKQGEEALRAREMDLNEAQRLAHIGSWHWDAQTDITTGTEELLRIYGFDPATQTIPNFKDQRGLWYPLEEWDRLNAAVQESVRTGAGYDLEVQALRNGQRIWVQTRSEALCDADGRIVSLRGTVQDITERKRAETALRKSEAKYRDLFENMTEEVHFWEVVRDESDQIKTWRLVDVNPPALKTWGRKSIEEIRGKTTDEIFGPGATEHYLSAVNKIMSERVPHAFEDYFPHLDKYFRFTSVPLGDHFITTGADITAIKKTEEAIRQRAEEIERLLEAVPAAVWVAHDSQCLTIIGNRKANEFYEAKPGENVSATTLPESRRFFTPDGRELPAEELPMQKAVTSNHDVLDTELYVELPSGRRITMLGSAVPLRDPQGNARGCIGAFMDITDRKKTEEALRESEARFRLALKNAPVSVAAQDRGLKYIWAYNQRTARPEEIVGHFDWDIFTPEEAAHVTAIKHRVLKENIELREQMWFNRPGERIFLDVCWEPIHDQSGQVIGVASATVDLTPIKLAEEALKASLAEKEVLLKEIHHRVKNNMQVISSLVDLQADEVKDSAMRAIFQDVIYRVRSMAMVHEKLYQSSDLAQVDFADYAQSLLVYLWRAQSPVASAIQLDLDLKPVSLSVNAAVPCGLILNELFSNALKHAFPGRGSGKVMVALDEDGGGKIRLRVCDDGVGLPSGLDWEKSHSLGLRIIRTLARQLNAKVEVSNVQGTQFTILFKR